MAETRYTWVLEDYNLYFRDTIGVYKSTPVYCLYPCNDLGESIEIDIDYSTEINQIKCIDISEKEYIVKLSALKFRKPSSITFEDKYNAGYIKYSEGGYKKGVSFENYTPISRLFYMHDPDDTNLNVALTNYNNSLYSYKILYNLFYRKRVFDLERFKKVIAGESLGCVIDENYSLSYNTNGIIVIFFKNKKVGYVENKKIVSKSKTAIFENLSYITGFKNEYT